MIPELIHDLDGQARFDVYLDEIRDTLKNNLSALILMPDIPDVFKTRDLIREKLDITPAILYRKQPKELDEWLKIRQGLVKVVVGTRSAVFAPLNNLGLMIIDSEEATVYKQDQVPHYHARDVAVMRSRLGGFKLILGSRSPSLESFYLADKQKLDYRLIHRNKKFPEVKIIDTRHLSFQERKNNLTLSRLLTDSIYSVLDEKGKVLLFLNRKGFATTCACHNCGKALKCPRCNINLVYHFTKGELSCNYCNFKMQPPEICPECNSGYIKFSGAGTERVESEISRIFPQAKTKILEEKDLGALDADIFISTSAVIKEAELDFDLIGVLGIDNVLNRVDFRSTEKVFELLAGLTALTQKKVLIQTSAPEHHCFQAFLKEDMGIFYKEELKQRKQLGFAPYKHMLLIKLRAKLEEKVKAAAESLYERLRSSNKDKFTEILSVNPSNPGKLRGNYYWQILLRSSKVLSSNEFLKKGLKGFRHSGIIVTVDVDPL